MTQETLRPAPSGILVLLALLAVLAVDVALFIVDVAADGQVSFGGLFCILLLPVIAAVSYEVIRFSGRHQSAIIGKIVATPGLWLQRLTTREPDDDQIEVAIRAMETAVAADTGDPARAEFQSRTCC